MVAGAFNGGGGGQWQQRHRRHNNQIKEEAAFGRPPTLSDAQSIGGRRLRDVGDGASAGLWGCSVGIRGAQAAAHRRWKGIGGAFPHAGGGVGGSTSAELWWGRCRGDGRWQHIRGSAVA